MTEWDIVGVITVLVGLFFSVGKPILKHNETVNKMLNQLENHTIVISNHSSVIEEHEDKLQDHEIRIHDLEHKE